MLKKISATLLVLVALLASMPARAEFRYGPLLGVTSSTLNFKQDLMRVEHTVGFNAGVVGEMMFPGIGFGVSIGAMYDLRGAKLYMGQRELWVSQGYTGTERVCMHYFTIPVHLRFKYTRLGGLEDKVAPLAYVGPTFGLQIADNGVKAFKYSGGDVSLEFGIGAEIFRNWQVTTGFSLGMTYVLKDKILTDYSARSNAWNVRVSYFF